MALELRTHDQTVAAAAAIAQQSCPDLTDLTPGSPFRALLEADAYNAGWLQYLAVSVLKMARASSSKGEDLDTFCADYGLTRLGAVPSSGTVTFSRFSTVGTALVPVGAVVKTVDGSVSFSVVRDTANPRWDQQLGGYVIAGGVASVTVPVVAVTPGASGNIRGATITMLASAMPGIDTVANAAAFQNGTDGETDDALRARFSQFINTRQQATSDAIAYAISSVQQGLTYSILENRDADGSEERGMFTVYVDDGTGAVNDELLSSIYSAISKSKALGVRFALHRAEVLLANVSLSITAKPGYQKAKLIGAVAAAVQDHINSLGVGEALSFYRLAHVAQDTVEGVKSVDVMTLNGGTGSIGGHPRQSIHAGSIAVS